MTRAGVDKQCHHPCVHNDTVCPYQTLVKIKEKSFYQCARVHKWVKIVKYPEFSIQED